MKEFYGKETHAPCSECGRNIFVTEADVTERDGKRFVEMTCISPACVAYNLPCLYNEKALEIHGTVAVTGFGT